MSPSLLPYYLIFWPGALPSTFDLPKHQEAKYLASVSARVDGLLQGLSVLFMLYANRMNPAPLSSSASTSQFCSFNTSQFCQFSTSELCQLSTSRPSLFAPTDPVGQSWHVCMHICMYVWLRTKASPRGRGTWRMGGATFACLPHCLPSLSPPNLLLIPASPSLPPSLPPPPSVHALRMCKRERQMFGTRRKGQNERRGGAKAAGLLRQHAVCMQHQGDTAPRVVGAGGGQEAGGERQEDSKIARA